MSDEQDACVPTGVPGLDEIVRGGFPSGHLYLVTGPSGAGKTTLSLQFLREGARRGERVLYLGTAETEEEIRLVARSHAWEMEGVEVRHYGGPTEGSRGPEQTMLHPAEVELPRTMEKLMAIVEEVKPQRLVIDSLSEIRLLSREESWFRHQIKILQRHVAGWQCTVLVTDLHSEDQPALRSGVHGVIELDQQTSVYGPDRRRLRVAKMRGVAHASGYHDLAIQSGGLRVFPRLVAAESRREARVEPVFSSGIEELDDLLGGGLDRGTSTLFVGQTGTGKSTLALACVVAAARRGEKTTMYLFDERVPTLFARMSSLGMDLEAHVEDGLVDLRQIDPAELTPGQFSQTVMDAVDSGSELIVLDSLNGYSYAMPEERLLGLYLHELISYLSQKGVASLMVATQHGVFTPQSSDFDISYVADTVVVLRPFEDAGRVRTALSVHKRRAGSHEKTVRQFELRDSRIVIGPPLEKFSGVIAGDLRYHGDKLVSPEDP